MKFILLSLVVVVALVASPSWAAGAVFNNAGCRHDTLYQQRFRPQLEAISRDVGRILSYVMADDREHGATYEQLSYFVDKFGPRFTGTPVLEQSIDFMLSWLRKEQHQNVHAENVTVPRWIRGEEKASMIAPRTKKMSILGLGYSVGTDGREIEAPVIVVHNFTELAERAAEVPGKIVVYNYEYKSYSESVKYRSRGASEAAKHGAVAAFVSFFY